MIKPPTCAWSLSDLESIKKNNFKVMSTFSCGGGSSMGYSLAGCEVIAANDIDPEMAWHYQHNLKTKYYFLCPIIELLTKDLPKELFNLDILDGSPPCSTFSISGSREKDWGREKHFREGQSKQILSDLFFDYLNLIDRLKPKVAIAENVKGMLFGNAKGYVKMIIARFREIGYRPQLFIINSADCGVPQTRERIFFVAIRDDIKVSPLLITPSHSWINAGKATADIQNLTELELSNTAPTKIDELFYNSTKPGNSYLTACKRLRGKASFFNSIRIHKDRPSPTLTANGNDFKHWGECRKLTFREFKRLSSFPDDYHAKSDSIGKYMVGMSVPPKMTEVVARAVIDQWLLPISKIK